MWTDDVWVAGSTPVECGRSRSDLAGWAQYGYCASHSRFFWGLRLDRGVAGQIIEPVNEAFKGQLHLERHRGRTPAGVMVRVLRRTLALTATIWHNDHTGQPIMRSLTAYDH